MSKSQVWSSLKALGYDSKQLKADHDVTYQSSNETLLQSILDKLQPTVVNEVVVSNDAVIKYLPTNHYHGIPYINIDEVVLVDGTKATVIETVAHYLFYTNKKPEDGLGANYTFLKCCNTRSVYQETFGQKDGNRFIKDYHKEGDPRERILSYFLLNYDPKQ